MNDSSRRESDRSKAHDGRSVTLVIPAHNAQATLGVCLDSVVSLLEHGELREIVVVEDQSSDDTAAIAADYPVRVIRGRGIGAAAARNDGIAQSAGEFIWCLDADCIARDNTLAELMAGFEDEVAAVGGSLGNASPASLLANLIQDEISWRHARMPSSVNFLASGNVVYRRSAFEALGGFDESFRWAHDAELAYRFRVADRKLRYRKHAVVLHHHFTNWPLYLSKQAAYAKNRILLYARYPANARGDDYSSWVDHLQPPLALGLLLTAPLVLLQGLWIIPSLTLLALLACSLITTCSVYYKRFVWRSGLFPLFSAVRSIARGWGACWGMLVLSVRRLPHAPRLLSRIDESR